MLKSENSDYVPNKFEKISEIISKDLNKKNKESFKVFPKDFDLSLKDKDEDILLVVRTPLKKYFPRMIGGVLFSIFLPVLIYFPISGLDGSKVFLIGMILTSVMLASTFILYSFLKWYYNVGIITSKRIINIKFQHVMSHSMAEARLEKVIDIRHKQNGLGDNISDVGNIYIHTGGGNPEMILKKIPKPRMVHDFLNRLLELKKKGEI